MLADDYRTAASSPPPRLAHCDLGTHQNLLARQLMEACAQLRIRSGYPVPAGHWAPGLLWLTQCLLQATGEELASTGWG